MKENVMILNFEKSTCCGCTACESICPKQAITMQPDENGFTVFTHAAKIAAVTPIATILIIETSPP